MYNINSQNIDKLVKDKGDIDKIIKKMMKSKDARSESIYLPSEISPDALFGKTSKELNKEKADLLSSVNK